MKRLVYCCVFLMCFSQYSWAISNSSFSQPELYLGISSGVTYPRVDSNLFLSTSPGWPDDYYHYTNVSSSAFFSLLGGYRWATGRTWFPYYSLGVNYTYVNPSKISGYIEQYSLPEFTNYDFQYNIQRQTILAMFKLDIHRWHNLMPFLTVGAGFSANKASGYEEQALSNVTPRVSPGYRTRTNTDFSYIFGAGLDLIATNKLLISLEYNYGYFGSAKTGYSTDNSNDYLSTKLSSNTVALSLSYFFDKFA